MSGREWKPGTVLGDASGRVLYAIEVTSNSIAAAKSGQAWEEGSSIIEPDGNGWNERHFDDLRPLVVIDPEDREQVERLASALGTDNWYGTTGLLAAALREFANPTPSEPTDPKARVTDRRDNIWRLLADGDWVCTSGPDIGEYLEWCRLSTERGPVSVVVQP